MDKVQTEIMSSNFSHTLFSLVFTHEDLEMQALVWLHIVQFIVVDSDAVQFGVSYTNLKMTSHI